MGTRSRVAWFLGGAFSVVAVLLGLAVWQTQSLMQWKPPREYGSVGPVAISPRWSVVLEEKASHPYLAEYDYRLRVFTSEDREGEYHGTVNLLPNSGGRTFLCLFTLTSPNLAPLLEVADRMESSIVDLQSLRRLPETPNGYERHFIGAFVEVAQPLRFVPAEIQSDCPSNR
jgi:hypothetical protein